MKTNGDMGSEDPVPQVKRLFRQQAVDFATSNNYGTVLLVSHNSHRALTIFFSLIITVIIFIFIFFDTTHKAEVSGVLLPSEGLIRIRPNQSGIVTKVFIKEGQKVKAGEVLVSLSNEGSINNHRSTDSVVSAFLKNRNESYRNEALQASQQSILRIRAAQKRKFALIEERQKLDAQLNLQMERVTLATQAFRRFKDLYGTHYISSAQLEDKEGELLDQRQRFSELERLKGINERDCASAEMEFHDLKYQSQRDKEALNRNTFSVQQDIAEIEARREIQVVSPTSGTVAAVTVNVGKPVSAENTLALILPAGSVLQAEIYAPSRTIGFVKIGMSALLRYQAYPYQKFGQYEAVVYEIADAPISAQEMTLPGVVSSLGQTSEPLYLIRLKLKQQAVIVYGKRIDLKPGMLIDASIVLEHRRLYEWILEPLFSISGRS